jgi:hypothetical protein
MSAHDHAVCLNTALSRADALCERRGVRFTTIRRKVPELIWANHESIKAYDLLEALKDFDASAKPATVYRALDFLIEQGLVHRRSARKHDDPRDGEPLRRRAFEGIFGIDPRLFIRNLFSRVSAQPMVGTGMTFGVYFSPFR